MEVPFQSLSKKQLESIIQDFILINEVFRGSDLSTGQKILRVQYMLDIGEARVFLDPKTKVYTVVREK